MAQVALIEFVGCVVWLVNPVPARATKRRVCRTKSLVASLHHLVGVPNVSPSENPGGRGYLSTWSVLGLRDPT